MMFSVGDFFGRVERMKKLLQHSFVKNHGSKFMRFVVCGGLGACVDFGTLHLLVAYAGWEEKHALLVSTGLALIFVFFANRFFTFRAHGSRAGKQVIKFLMVYLVAASLNYAFSLGFIAAGAHYLLAKAMAIGLVMFFNYFSLNGFVFKKSPVVADEVFVA